MVKHGSVRYRQDRTSVHKEAAKQPACPVNSHTEWDPLEEVIVGHIDDATIPSRHVTVMCNMPASARAVYPLFSGRRYPRIMSKPANRELDAFVRLLESEGVRVRRPDPHPFHNKFASPIWKSHGFTCACPRDSMLIIGDEIIETPMAWRSRYFETFAYRSLTREYFNAGARWTSAPKPELSDALYEHDYKVPEKGEPVRYVINEHEPVFDAADFVRCGRDLFVTRSNVTNYAGINWLRRHLNRYHEPPNRESQRYHESPNRDPQRYHESPNRDVSDARLGEPRYHHAAEPRHHDAGEPRYQYRITEIISHCPQPMHIDTTFMPLGPDRILINPEYVRREELPPILRHCEVLTAPEPDPVRGRLLKLTSMCGKWLNMNVLSLDEKRIICEAKQPSMIRALKEWGFEPIPCEFQHHAAFGGAFHCATLDVRRTGELRSYFD